MSSDIVLAVLFVEKYSFCKFITSNIIIFGTSKGIKYLCMTIIHTRVQTQKCAIYLQHVYVYPGPTSQEKWLPIAQCGSSYFWNLCMCPLQRLFIVAFQMIAGAVMVPIIENIVAMSMIVVPLENILKAFDTRLFFCCWG